jgi:hypothetical protein
VAVPLATPVTEPEPLTVAMLVLFELHTPPDVELLSVVDEPAHILEVPPVIAATVGVILTVIILVVLLPHEAL